ncbi:MAG: hypothetical protein JSV96_03015 [Candidatus Aminicenantes bacterium]|nr:MAG: hypothetical protein JSV96_03015 [Candidatus Aminicenantes bacterium]
MKNKIILTFSLLFFFSGLIPLQGQTSFTLTKDIHVAEGEVQKNVISFGGNVLIEGEVEESVVAFGGSIIVKGEVGDVVLGIGSTITLKSSAVIRGDVASLGGSLTKEPGCIIDGDTIYFETSEEVTKFLKEGLVGILGISLIPLLLIIKLVSIFIWFLLALIVAAIFPRQISFAASQIRKSFWPIFGTGFLSLVIFTGLAIFSGLLILLIIGIPILLALILIGIIIKIFGRVTLFYFFGESLSRAFGSKNPSTILAVILGLILVSIITFIPIIGTLFSFFLSIMGWGAAVRTKFGTTENWFRKK